MMPHLSRGSAERTMRMIELIVVVAALVFLWDTRREKP